MKTLHRIISDYAKAGTKVEISRRDLAKIKAEVRRPLHPTVTTRLMNTSRLPHEGKMYWPTVYSREAPKRQGEVRSNLSPEHPMIAARKASHPQARTQGKRTR